MKLKQTNARAHLVRYRSRSVKADTNREFIGTQHSPQPRHGQHHRGTSDVTHCTTTTNLDQSTSHTDRHTDRQVGQVLAVNQSGMFEMFRSFITQHSCSIELFYRNFRAIFPKTASNFTNTPAQSYIHELCTDHIITIFSKNKKLTN